MVVIVVLFPVVASSGLAAMVVTCFSTVQIAGMIVIIIRAIRRAIMMMGNIYAALIATSHAANEC